MTQKENHLDSTQALVSELFDSNEAIKAKFQEHVSTEILLFGEALVPAFKRFPSFAEACAHNVQTSLVGAFVHGVLDDLVVSVKLLLMGKLGPSGNAYRQALEGICMSAMCAHADTLLIGEKEQTYWQLVADDSKSATGDLAARQFLKNWERLGLNLPGAEQLKEALAAHHEHSHAGRLALANRMDLGPDGRIHFGGHFDPAKLEGYGLEMKQRINGARWAVELIDGLLPHVKKLSATTPAAAQAKPA
ncbi:hypothetical protein [Variovorax sp. R-27]|uniref:hypothetical protein n=1 Tax=Variovorax sp. R-27 TaxID=3404058 RepID=UPI003CF2E3C3